MSRGPSSLEPHTEEIRRLVACGVPQTWIARKYGVNSSTILAHLRRHGIRRNDGGDVQMWLKHPETRRCFLHRKLEEALPS